MRAAYKEKAYTRTVELSKTVLRMTDLEADDLAALKTIARKANEQMALRNLEWMLERAARYKNLSLEVADAEKTVTEAPQVAQYFPKSDYPNSQDNLLFFTACAYKILNRNEEALEKIEQCSKNTPQRRSDRGERLGPNPARGLGRPGCAAGARELI
jgi:hypothetical protein